MVAQSGQQCGGATVHAGSAAVSQAGVSIAAQHEVAGGEHSPAAREPEASEAGAIGAIVRQHSVGRTCTTRSQKASARETMRATFDARRGARVP